MAEEAKKKNSRGRPKGSTDRDGEVMDEPQGAPLMMEDREPTIEEFSNRWQHTFGSICRLDRAGSDVAAYMHAWNRANPFIQNQRVKSLSTHANQYTKEQLAQFAANPAGAELPLRGAAMTASSSQQIYYNILRRACDVPLYNHFVVPPKFIDGDAEYKKDEFKQEAFLVDNWLDVLNVPNSLKTIALQVKREGKCTYIFRNRFVGVGKQRRADYACFEKLPSDWIKITGIGQLGYTVSFDFGYFLQVGNDPRFFGEDGFFVRVWNDMMGNGLIKEDPKTHKKSLDMAKARGYKFDYDGTIVSSMIETRIIEDMQTRFLFWVTLPFDLAYTFASDNSVPFVAPDTTGLLQKLQELTDYGTLAGLIASTPLTAVLTGEAEFVEGARPNKNETKISPEVLLGLQQMFNSMTSSNIEAYFLPVKNIKLQQLNADVNSSDITTNATKNLIAYAGEGGLTITTDKPSIAQVRTAQKLAASQQHYVTLQIENVINYIMKHCLGFKYLWKVRIWGDIFFGEDEKASLKEQVQAGNIALLPKLMSAERISMSDAEALASYVESLGIYDRFRTLTQDHAAELGQEQAEAAAKASGNGTPGRPRIPDSKIESDGTAISRDTGVDTKGGRETAAAKCPLCHSHDLVDGEEICEACLERVMEAAGE